MFKDVNKEKANQLWKEELKKKHEGKKEKEEDDD